MNKSDATYEIRNRYQIESGKDYLEPVHLYEGFEDEIFTDDYVFWLEQNIIELSESKK